MLLSRATSPFLRAVLSFEARALLPRRHFASGHFARVALPDRLERQKRKDGGQGNNTGETAVGKTATIHHHIKEGMNDDGRIGVKVEGPIPLQLGGTLPEAMLCFESIGDPHLPADRTVLLCPGLSASSHAKSSLHNNRPGWWQRFIGPGLGIDTRKWRVIAVASLGSPFGPTSPLSINPDTGKQYGPTFPQITPHDQVAMHAHVLDHLGLDKVHAVVGGSLGGIQALQFAAQFPDRLDRCLAISCTGKTTPSTVAIRSVQRQAIMNDPDYNGGNYYPNPGPLRGMGIARQVGTISYRSAHEFNNRFDWDPDENNEFEVERYLKAQADKFSHTYDPNCYLTMSKCMDLHDLGRGYESYAEGVLRIKCRTHLIGVDRDMLIPITELEGVAALLQGHGRNARFEVHSSEYGHDAFLIDYRWYNPRIDEFLSRDVDWAMDMNPDTDVDGIMS